MPTPINPDEYTHASRGLAPKPVGLGGLFGSAVDRTQGSLYGIAEAMGIDSAADHRMLNQIDADNAAQRYYAETGDPRTWAEAQGLSGVGKFARNMAIQSAPYMVGTALGGLVGGAPGAFIAGTALGTGDVLDNQREQAGQTDILSALPLGVAYGAADSMFGLGGIAGRAGAAVRRGAAGEILGTGIKAFDKLGAGNLDKLTGWKGGAARMGVTGLKHGVVEAGTEAFQEGMNQLGRMAVDPTEDFYNDRSAENFKENAIGGALLGSMFGGLGGGWRRSAGYQPPSAKELGDPNKSVDVLSGTTTQLPETAPFEEHLKDYQPTGSLEEQMQEVNTLRAQRQGLWQQIAEFERNNDQAGYYEFIKQAGPVLDDIEYKLQTLEHNTAALWQGQPRPEGQPQQPQVQLGLALPAPRPTWQEQINESTGVGQGSYIDAIAAQQGISPNTARRNYVNQFEAAASEPTGQILPDTSNGQIERPETMHEAILRQAGMLQEAQQAQAEMQAAKEAYKVKEAAARVGMKVPDGLKIPNQVVNAYHDIQQLKAAGADVADLSGRLADGVQRNDVNDVKAVFKDINAAKKAQEKQVAEATAQAPAAQGTVKSEAAPAAPVAPTAPAQPPAVTYKRKLERPVAATTAAPVVQEAAPAQEAQTAAPRVHTVGTATAKPQSGYDPLNRHRAGFSRIKKINSAVKELDRRIKAVSSPIVVDGRLPEVEKERLFESERLRQRQLAELERRKQRLVVKRDMALPTRAELHEYIKPLMDRSLADGLNPKRAREHLERVKMLEALTGMQLDKKTGELKRTIEGPVAQATFAENSGNLSTGEKSSSRQAVLNKLNRLGLTEAHLERIYADVGSELSEAASAELTSESDAKVEGDDLKPGLFSSDDFNSSSDSNADLLWAPEGGNPGVRVSDSAAAATGGVGWGNLRVGNKDTDAQITPETYKKARDLAQALVTKASSVEGGAESSIKVLWKQEVVDAKLHNSTEVALLHHLADMADNPKDKYHAGALRLLEIVKPEAPQTDAAKARAAKEEAAAKAETEARAKREAEIEARNKARAREELMRGAAAFVKSDEGRYVVQDWNEAKSELEPSFEQLPPETQLQWILGYQNSYEVHQDERTSLDEFKRSISELQRSIARGVEPNAPTSTVDARSARGGEQASGAGDRGGDKGGDQGRSTGEDGLSTETTQVSKEDLDAAKEKYEGEYDGDWSTLSDTERKDLVQALNADEYSDAPSFGEVAGMLVTAKALARGVQHSKAEPTGSSTVAGVLDEIKNFLQLGALSNKVVVVQSASELPQHILKSKGMDETVQGLVNGGKAYLIAGNIAPGKAASVFMHEVGMHLGLQKLLGADQLNALVKKVNDWAAKADGSQESKIAQAALNRVKAAGTADANASNETLAYFLEEAVNAGVNPTAQNYKTELGRWLSRVWTAFKEAVAKLGVNPNKLTAQDVVDMAYGAAQMELASKVDTDRTPTQDTDTQYSKAAPAKPGTPAALTSGWKPLWDSAKAKGNWTLVRGMMTTDLIDAASKVIPSAKAYLESMDAINVERTKAERAVGVVMSDFNALKQHEKTAVNAMLMESTMSKKWAFVPEWLKGKNIKADPELADRFNSLSESAQAVVKQVFKHGYDTMQQLQDEVKKNVTSEYDAVIAQLTKEGDTAGVKREEAKKAKSLLDFQSLLDQNGNWPYTPLRRFGNHVVIGMSSEYLAAKEANDSKLMQKLEQDGNHYQVAFAETRRAAVVLKGQMEQNPAFQAANGGYSDNFERLSQVDGMMGGRDMLSAFRRVRKLATDSMEGEGAAAREGVDNAMRQLYLQLLAESSARKGEMNRRNVVGADKDMMRAFATNGRSTAHFIANLKTGATVDDNLEKMQSEVRATKPGREERQRYFNEIMKRHTMGLTYSPTPFVDKALGFTSSWMLLTNPSHFLMNASQPWMMSVPTMGGHFGIGKAASAMLKAYREVMPLLKELNKTFDDQDKTKIPADVRSAVTELANKGIISIELSHELGQFETHADGNKVTDAMSTGLEAVKSTAQKVETLNRLTTAIAAYRLSRDSHLANGKDAASADKLAIDYAKKIINDTHGNYEGFNYPRFMRTDFGRIVTQFRKFQLIQASMFIRLMNDAVRGKTPAEKSAARWALTYTVATMAAVGGISALPGYMLVSMLYGLAGGGDEPEDPRADLYKAVGQEWGDFMYGGLSKFFGVPLGDRVGAGQMLSLLPYTDFQWSGKGYKDIAVGAMGPLFGGILPKAFEGMGMIGAGEWQKGAEMMSPTALSNASKAYRYFTEGVTQRNGDVTIPAEDISVVTAAFQALGLPTSMLNNRMENANAVFKSDEFYKGRTTELKNRYTAAVREGDSETAGEIRDRWQRLQEKRVENGYSRQPLSDLLKAPQEQRKRESMVSGGVEYRKANRGAVEALTQE